MKKMKKRILVTAIAASLILSSTAVLPFGNYEVINKLGANTAFAASLPAATIARIETIRASVLPADLPIVNAAKYALDHLSDITLVSDVWGPIQAKIGLNTSTYGQITQTNILALFAQLGMISYADASGLESIRTGSLRPVMDQLAMLGSLDPAAPINLVPEDFVSFFDRVETLVKEGALLHLSEPSMRAFITDKIIEVINDHSYKLSQIFFNIGISSDHIIAMKNKMEAVVDPSGNARKAMEVAYVRSLVQFSASNISNYGRTVIPSLTILGITIPNSLLAWHQSSGYPDIAMALDGTLTLNNSVGSGVTKSTVIEASIFGKELKSATVSLTYSPGGGVTPPTTTTTTPTPTPTPTTLGPDVVEAAKVLEAVRIALTNLHDKAVGDIGSQPQEIMEEAIRHAASTDMSTTVITQDGVAKPTIDLTKFDDVFKKVQNIGILGNTILKNIFPGAAPAKVVAELDFGKVDAKKMEIPITQELIAKAKAAGIKAIAFTVNGVSLTVDVDQLNADTILTITKESSTATSPAGLKIVSDVYNFEFTQNGKKVTDFNKPIEVRIPVPDTTGLDTEFLVFAKIDNGDLINKAGKYNPVTKEFIAANKSFSTYVVYENKIVFNDTESVKDWAGRQIEVAVSKGIIDGRGNQKFAPTELVTRAEFIKMIVKEFVLEDATAVNQFSDVSKTDWYSTYIASGVKAGLIYGRSNDKFEPNAYITRAEMATIAARALIIFRGYSALDNYDAALVGFADTSNSSLKPGISLSVSQGIMIGQGNKLFNPNANSTRAEAAVVIYRLFNK